MRNNPPRDQQQVQPKPTFEERYGPWICMGCGTAHKLGDACPPLTCLKCNGNGIVEDDPHTETPGGTCKSCEGTGFVQSPADAGSKGNR